MFNIIKTIYKESLDILAPRFCFYCRNFFEKEDYLCDLCLSQIKNIPSSNINVGNLVVPIYAVSSYQNPLKSLILAKSLSMPFLSMYIANIIWKYSVLPNIEFDCLVPIPLHWSREAYRGFNQSELIAKELSKISKKPVINLLKRNKRTKFQSLFDVKGREENVKNVFELNYLNFQEFENKTILLVDDLMTTGATLKSAAKTLQYLKPKNIKAVVACRTI